MRPTRFALPRLAAPVAAILLLGACDYFGGTTSEEVVDASGEVMSGSVSDAMIPTDDLTSQPPALAIQPGEAGAAAAGIDAADSAQPAADGASAEPAAEAAPAESDAAE